MSEESKAVLPTRGVGGSGLLPLKGPRIGHTYPKDHRCARIKDSRVSAFADYSLVVLVDLRGIGREKYAGTLFLSSLANKIDYTT